MSEIVFPNGFGNYRYCQGCDFIPSEFKMYSPGTVYKNLESRCLKIFPDLSNITSCSSMFAGSKFLTVPLFDTSNVTNMSSMFSNCPDLVAVPLFDTSKVTDMSNMFSNCNVLTTIPQFDTSNVTTMSYMFQSPKLVRIPELDCGKLTNISYMFGFNTMNYLTDLGGFKDLGKTSSLSGTSNSYFLGACPYLTYESIMNVINNLYDRAAAGYSVLTLKLHARGLALLSDDDKAIATNKGWTLS